MFAGAGHVLEMRLSRCLRFESFSPEHRMRYGRVAAMPSVPSRLVRVGACKLGKKWAFGREGQDPRHVDDRSRIASCSTISIWPVQHVHVGRASSLSLVLHLLLTLLLLNLPLVARLARSHPCSRNRNRGVHPYLTFMATPCPEASPSMSAPRTGAPR